MDSWIEMKQKLGFLEWQLKRVCYGEVTTVCWQFFPYSFSLSFSSFSAILRILHSHSHR